MRNACAKVPHIALLCWQGNMPLKTAPQSWRQYQGLELSACVHRVSGFVLDAIESEMARWRTACYGRAAIEQRPTW